MRHHRVLFILLLLSSFASIYALSARAQTPPPVDAPKAVTEEEARQFIEEYVARFMKLKFDPFMELFSKEAVENRMLPYADIREAYQATIVGSRSINYKLKIYSIQIHSRSAFVTGHYEIIQVFKKFGKSAFSGDIQWTLVRENGSLKIRELNYGRSY
jgi:hypothetical protein